MDVNAPRLSQSMIRLWMETTYEPPAPSSSGSRRTYTGITVAFVITPTARLRAAKVSTVVCGQTWKPSTKRVVFCVVEM